MLGPQVDRAEADTGDGMVAQLGGTRISRMRCPNAANGWETDSRCI